MPDMQIDDEILMAYADRELVAAEARAVEEAVAEDPELARRLGLFSRTRADAKSAFAEVAGDWGAPELVAKVKAMVAEHQRLSEGSDRSAVKPMPLRPASRWSDWGTSRLMAASLAALAIGVAGYLAGHFAAAPAFNNNVVAIGSVEAPELAAALSLMSGGDERRLTPNRGEPLVRMVASFRDAAGTLCREFELHGLVGPATLAVACRPGPVWTIGFAVTVPPAGDSYAPASATEALDAYLQSIGGDETLSEAEERAALRVLK